MKVYLKFAIYISIVFTSLNVQAQSIQSWIDVTINTSGKAEKVVLITPKLPPEMAKPIEDAVRQWEFEPGSRDGKLVKRTTSLAIIISFDNSGKEPQIIAKKIKEGPRIVQKSDTTCLNQLLQRGVNGNVLLKLTVSPDGSVSEIKVNKSNATEEFENCIVSIMKNTIFKPETLDGSPISTKLERQFRFKQPQQ